MTRIIPEGTWFAVPLRKGGYALGVVARTTSKGGVVLAYFFPHVWNSVPAIGDLAAYKPASAIRILRVGDLGLVNGTWPTIGRDPTWQRADWPTPYFVRRDELSGRAWRVEYSDTDANVLLAETPISDSATMERDAVFGAGAVEVVLTKTLSVR